MASHPPGPCCYKGVKHEGTPTGEISQLGDFEIYTKAPAGGDNSYGLLIVTDVIGHRFPNAQLIADQFAANGYFVMMPDLFDKNPIPLNRPGDFDIMKWLNGGMHPNKRSNLPPNIDPIVDSCIIEMRTKYGCRKLGGVGYCFGGKYVVRHGRPDLGKLDASYTAHPSFVEEDELKDLKAPLSIAAAETDIIFPNEKRHRTEDILRELKTVPYQINLYASCEHGFAVRGDPNNSTVQYAKEAAFLQAVQWFDVHLKAESLESKEK